MVINYIKRNKYLFIFLCGLLFISFISGIIIYLNIDNNVKLDLFNNVFNIKESLINNRINNIFNHLFVVILIVLLSFSCLGYFLGLFYLFYEGMSISFTFMFLCQIKGLKGLIFILLYDLLFNENLSKEDIKAIKKVAVDLLEKIKGRIAELDHWTDKQETKAEIDNLIRDTLWMELPESYDEIRISEYRQKIYEYVYMRYKEVA